MPTNEIDNLLDKVIPLDDAQADRDIMVLEGLNSGKQIIEKSVDAAKDAILKHAPPEQEQGVFSFLPTELSRTSPFFPMSKRGTHTVEMDFANKSPDLF
jgi:hypothetical protein